MQKTPSPETRQGGGLHLWFTAVAPPPMMVQAQRGVVTLFLPLPNTPQATRLGTQNQSNLPTPEMQIHPGWQA